MIITVARASLIPMALALIPQSVWSSGFALIEQSGSGTGNAYSGAAAAAEDASTIYFNPAGMSLLPSGRHISIGGHYIEPSARFRNGTSTPATLFGGASSNLTSEQAGVSALVPNAYFVMDWSPDMRLGLGISVPFGLTTEYSNDWVGRFQAIKSELMTININPSVSWKINDRLAIGMGLNYQNINAEFTSKTNYAASVFSGVVAAGGGVPAATAAAAGVATAGQAEGLTTLKGKDAAWGWNTGIAFALSAQTRLAAAYRSRIKYSLEGTVKFDNRPAALAAAAPDGNIKLDVSMPDTLSLALSHLVNPRLQILGDVTWTGWKVLSKFEAVRTNSVPVSGSALLSIPYNWRNTWRIGIGANYQTTDRWMLKAGIAYDQTPTNNTDRGVRLPDGNRTWLSAGAKYRLSDSATLDFGYARLRVKDPGVNSNAGGVNQSSTAAFALLNGKYESSVNILSAQYNHRF
jgi:long-chain fatty acid transport protein